MLLFPRIDRLHIAGAPGDIIAIFDAGRAGGMMNVARMDARLHAGTRPI